MIVHPDFRTEEALKGHPPPSFGICLRFRLICGRRVTNDEYCCLSGSRSKEYHCKNKQEKVSKMFPHHDYFDSLF